MNYLLDTNVISEVVKTQPESKVIHWLKLIPEDSIFLSVLTIGEIRKEIDRILDKQRKQKLLLWLEHELSERFSERLLPITLEIAYRWGRLLSEVKRSLPAIDSLLAATALHHDLVLVTRNEDDFRECPGLEIFNPWIL